MKSYSRCSTITLTKADIPNSFYNTSLLLKYRIRLLHTRCDETKIIELKLLIRTFHTPGNITGDSGDIESYVSKCVTDWGLNQGMCSTRD